MNKIIKTKNSKQKTFSLIESLILIIAIFAFAWMIGSEFKTVSAATCVQGPIGNGLQECSNEGDLACDNNQDVGAILECIQPTSGIAGVDPNKLYWNGYALCDDNEICSNCECAPIEEETPVIDEPEVEVPEEESGESNPNGLKSWETALIGDITGIVLEKGSELLFSSGRAGTTGGEAAAQTGTEVASGSSSGFLDSFIGVLGKGGESVAGSIGGAIGSSLGVIAMAWAAYSGIVYFLDAMGVAWENYHTLEQTALYTTIGVSALGVIYGVLLYVGILATIPGAGWIAAAIIIVVTAIVAAFTYQDFSLETFTYIVQPWKAPYGGERCEKCNKLDYGCNEYQCHSFGAACGIVNKGTQDEKCAWLNPDDHLSPDITLNQQVLDEQDLKSKPLDITLPSSEKGFEILPKSGEECIASFTEVKIGLITNELAECKFDLNRSKEYNNMLSYMEEGNSLIYNHTLIIPAAGAPSTSALENLGIELENGLPKYLLYFKCRDMNENTNNADFIIQFCIEEGPDTHAPVIKGTSVTNPAYISNNQTSAEIEVYTNEPADCKWDFEDTSYDRMTYNMTDCSSQLQDYLVGYNYGCKVNLTGIKKEQQNKYYFRCKDQPWLGVDEEHLRNPSGQSYVQILTGTSSLLIDSLKVNDKDKGSIIKDSTSPVQVRLVAKTSNGAEEGKAKCKYSFDGFEDWFTNGGQFWQGTDGFRVENYQDLFLDAGNYNISVTCFDIGGNVAYDSIEFSVEQDLQAPIITRAYFEEGYLKLITDEESSCVYSLFNEGCNYLFVDGNEISTTDGINHLVEWSTEAEMYIKCKDEYGNLPESGQCSIQILNSENFEEESN